MTKKKKDTPQNPDIVRHYNPFSSWQSLLIRLSELTTDLITEMHLRFFSLNRKTERRILGVWDFHIRGGGYGDVMTFLENLAALRTKYNLKGEKNIDLCFIDDNSHYNAKKEAFRKPATWKRQMMSLAYLSPYLGSIYYFRSEDEFKRFYISNRNRYYRWPISVSISQPSNIHVVSKHKKVHGKIPGFVLPPEIIDDIYTFYEKSIFPSMPVIINIRKNTRNISRNTDVAEIQKFIKHYEKNDKYKFIIICMKEEVPAELRKMKNVFFSKEIFGSLDHDLGFVATAYVALFPSSGMANFAWFNNVPFIQFGRHANDPYSAPKQGELFTEYQHFVHKVEKASWLIPYFDALIEDLKIRKINNTLENTKKRESYNYKF
jgi:hypothetical protein